MADNKNIDHAIISFDKGSDYELLWPLVSQSWKEVCSIHPLAFVLSENSSEFDNCEFGEIKNVKIEEGFHKSLQSQLLRLYSFKYLQDKPESICVISDADMIAINHDFFNKGLALHKEGKIVSFYRHIIGTGEIPICYNLGTVNTFIEIFKLNEFDTFRDFLSYIKLKYKKQYEKLNGNKNKFGWPIDQVFLWDCFIENQNKFITPTFELNRLDRSRWPNNETLESNLKLKIYNDCHFFNSNLNIDLLNLAKRVINLSKKSSKN